MNFVNTRKTNCVDRQFSFFSFSFSFLSPFASLPRPLLARAMAAAAHRGDLSVMAGSPHVVKTEAKRREALEAEKKENEEEHERERGVDDDVKNHVDETAAPSGGAGEGELNAYELERERNTARGWRPWSASRRGGLRRRRRREQRCRRRHFRKLSIVAGDHPDPDLLPLPPPLRPRPGGPCPRAPRAASRGGRGRAAPGPRRPILIPIR